jgi:DNA-3-methyladenine glycosylase II
MGSTYENEYRHLARRERVFARLIDEYGRPDAFQWIDGGRTGSSRFAAMVLHIMGQQISTAVAFIIFDRVADAAGGDISPSSMIGLGPARLRRCGLSDAKASYIVNLAEAEAGGKLNIENMDALPDDQVIARLTALRGIGPWSVQMFLIHQLRRPDVLPAGDVGIRRAIARAWELPMVPVTREVRGQAELWAPYRTFASALLWRSLNPSASSRRSPEPMVRVACGPRR